MTGVHVLTVPDRRPSQTPCLPAPAGPTRVSSAEQGGSGRGGLVLGARPAVEVGPNQGAQHLVMDDSVVI